MKGYCKCGVEIDEVEFTELGMCLACYTIEARQSGYDEGYTDALWDVSDDDNDGDHEPYHMEEDYD